MRFKPCVVLAKHTRKKELDQCHFISHNQVNVTSLTFLDNHLNSANMRFRSATLLAALVIAPGSAPRAR